MAYTEINYRNSFYESKFRELDALEGTIKDLLKLIEDHFITSDKSREATYGQMQKFESLWANFVSYSENICLYCESGLRRGLELIDLYVGDALKIKFEDTIKYSSNDSLRFYYAANDFKKYIKKYKILKHVDSERELLGSEMSTCL